MLRPLKATLRPSSTARSMTVSYTHLDVYKRQALLSGETVLWYNSQFRTRLTCGLIKNKLEEFGLAGKTKFVEIVPRQKIKLGCFRCV